MRTNGQQTIQVTAFGDTREEVLAELDRMAVEFFEGVDGDELIRGTVKFQPAWDSAMGATAVYTLDEIL